MIGNTKLVEYGIQTDQSDYRAHVCVLAEKVYVFKTDCAKTLVKSGIFRTVPVWTNGIVTATGHPIPVLSIPGIKSVDIPKSWIEKIAFDTSDTTSEKGEKAVKIVKGILLRGKFPASMDGEIIDETDMQIRGFDITVNLKFSIQVKCDYRGGIGGIGTTGNLFFQISECNPWRQI